MDIADAVTTEYVDVNPGTRLGKIRGIFDGDQTLEAIVVRGESDKFEGIVTRKDLVSSHHDPEAKVRSVVRHPPTVARDEDVRETARLMVEGQVKMLPVLDDDGVLRGVVNAKDLLEMVQDNLGALDVSDVYTEDVVSVEPDTVLGKVIHTIRTHKFTRVPVIDGTDAVGMISLYDLVDFTTRKMTQEQGGNNNATDSFGGGVSKSQGRTHGGWGERSGLEATMTNLPARDVMNSPAATIPLDAGLDEAFAKMQDHGYSSLIVVPEEFESPAGIVTITDLLRALTWTGDQEQRSDVQVFGVDLLDVLSREEIVERIDEIDGKYKDMDILEANVRFHKHKEQHRGTPFVRCTIRLFTDEGLFSGTGEEYGAQAAFKNAADIVERNALDDKERESPRHQMEQERERTAELVEWWTTTETSS
ncbi:CBS domain-containing protein [Halorussus sp. MSC15.2]|uniref:CBS domain-containing protein n=1 Tax=Halorussus sp. MSC15.2 TaxID=2283638 RepID=UPI0013D71235|nr:CBS domain-containing protein [Halorussus sp. MSC15.2]NEU56408.1 CBS domain-containing protein [Halorussus sp. MSC15.2]